MKQSNKVFHLAIPCKNLSEAAHFYEYQLGCQVVRRYHDRVTINFFGDQVVCHLSPENIDENPKMYPRHFGITFLEESDFEKLYDTAKKNKARFFKDKFTRFSEKKERHETFFLIDPSNNILEFKFYHNKEMVY